MSEDSSPSNPSAQEALESLAHTDGNPLAGSVAGGGQLTHTHTHTHPPAWAAAHPWPPVLARRRDLPEQREKAQKASLWTIVKESVGAHARPPRPGSAPRHAAVHCRVQLASPDLFLSAAAPLCLH